MSRPLPPELQNVILGFRRLGEKVLSAGVAKGLEELGRLTQEVDRRVKRGARQAGHVANGEPMEPEDDE